MESNSNLREIIDPTVSVIICAYNAQDTIAEAIVSVLNQTYTQFEIIFVNDGSKDSTLDQARSLAANDSRIKIVDQINKGLGASRNIALDLCFGKYVAFLDADDTWSNDKLALQLQVFENSQDADIVITETMLYGASKNISTHRTQEIENIQDYFELVAGHNLFFSPATALIKRELFEDARFTHDHSGQDYYPFLAWSVMNYRLYRINRPLYAIRILPGSLQRSSKALYTSGLARYKSINAILTKTDFRRYLTPQRIEILMSSSDRFLRWATHGARKHMRYIDLINFVFATYNKYFKKRFFIIELFKSILPPVYKYPKR